MALLLSALIWIIATTGGRQIFVKEVLGDAFDSQAEHFLRGDVGVDVEAIRPEAMLVGDKVCMYFGPFPAFLRMPLNLIYPAGRGAWSRISGFCAAVIALSAFAGLVSESLRFSGLSTPWRTWLGNACLVGFAFGSPLLFLVGSLSIYNEAILWGLAWSLAALFFAYKSRKSDGCRLTILLLGFSFSAAAALLSRVTFGAPLLLIAPVLALALPSDNRPTRLAALLLPLSAGLAFYFLLNYAKFGTLTGFSYDYYINAVHREFAHKYGILNLGRVPYSFADYFNFRFPPLQSATPFLIAQRHPYLHPSSFSLPFSETYLSIPWCSGWLLCGAIIGIIFLLHPNRSTWFDRSIALALFAQFICILSYYALAQRYSAELYPFLIFCFLLFLRTGGTVWARFGLLGLITVSIVANSLATASWIGGDGNLPLETRAFWNAAVGKSVPATSAEKK